MKTLGVVKRTLNDLRPPGLAQISYAFGVTLAYAVLLGLEILTSVVMADGHFVYSLDDPYIHLALAENILSGVYGVNLTEAASPSSSILYPFLMALTQALGLRSLGPLMVDGLAGVASVWLAARFVRRYALGELDTPRRKTFAAAVGLLLILCLSAIALPMTGLEHMIHVLLVVCVLGGLAEVAQGEPASRLLVLATTLTPLIRFEGIALAGAAIVALWLLGRRQAAFVSALAILAGFGAYFAFMAGLGLPLLPSSILVKSPLAAAAVDVGGLGAMLAPVAGGLGHSLATWEGRLLIAMLAGLAAGMILSPPGKRRANAVMAGVAGASLAAHVVAGAYNWFHRYEVYANVIGVLSLTFVWRARLSCIAREGSLAAQALVLSALALVSVPYAYAALRTPVASRGVYDQQFQMHRFAAEFYGMPVAVNDLGLVSYRNDNFVLDLWGLGSERVRRMKAAGRFGQDEINRIAARNRVGVAMIFEPWFPGQIPADWRRVAVLHTTGQYAACDGVAFFETPDADSARVASALVRLQRVLPARDRLDFGVSPAVHCRRDTATIGLRKADNGR